MLTSLASICVQIGVGPTPKYDTTSPAQVMSDECPVTHPKHFAEVPNVDKTTRFASGLPEQELIGGNKLLLADAR